VYTYWRRTIPPPIMMSFNAGDREVCTMRQSRTNTPLQALTLMNNVTFVESARVLAEEMLHAGESFAVQVQRGYQSVMAREASKEEIGRLEDDYSAFLSEFSKTPDAVTQLLKTGEKPYDQNLNSAQLAAMTIVASTLLNLDESLTRE